MAEVDSSRMWASIAWFTAFLLAVVLLGFVAARRNSPVANETTETPAAHPQPITVEYGRFSAHRERTADGEWLSISLRVRTNAGTGLPCYVFFVARNDHVTPKLWAIWPPEAAGAVITPSGYFHGTHPAAGYSITLTTAWERLTATVPQAAGSNPFDTIDLYVLTPDGKVLLTRPFRT